MLFRSSLYKLGGINNVEGNLKDQLVSVKGTSKANLFLEACMHILTVPFFQLPHQLLWRPSKQLVETLSCVDQELQTVCEICFLGDLYCV